LRKRNRILFVIILGLVITHVQNLAACSN
jgi:hypothetical protein